MNTEIDMMDLDLLNLEHIVRGIDLTLASLQRDTSWNEGARDLADYWSGVGFVACQKYLVAVTARADVERRQALDAGPRLNGGSTVVSIINAAANAWKHESEWLEEGQRSLNDGREEPENRRRDQALDALGLALGEYDWEYKFANTLYALCGEVAFSPLMSHLTQWRDVLFAAQSLQNFD